MCKSSGFYEWGAGFALLEHCPGRGDAMTRRRARAISAWVSTSPAPLHLLTATSTVKWGKAAWSGR